MVNELFYELNRGKVICFDRGGKFEKYFKIVAGRYYHSFDGIDWAPTNIDVGDKLKRQTDMFSVGGKYI